MRYRSPSLVSLLTLLAFLTSACAEDPSRAWLRSANWIWTVTTLIPAPSIFAMVDWLLNLAAADGDACIGGEPDSILSRATVSHLSAVMAIRRSSLDRRGLRRQHHRWRWMLRIVHRTHLKFIDYPARGEQLDGESMYCLGRVVDYGVGFECHGQRSEAELDEDGDFEFPCCNTWTQYS